MNTTRKRAGALLIALTALALGGAQPALAQADKRVPITAATTEQKLKFVTNLITQSAAIRMIEGGSDTEAKQALAGARGLVDQARQDAAAGRYEAADGKLNKAVESVMAQSRRLSETSVKADRAQEVYQGRVASVKAMLDAYQRVAEEKRQGGQAIERRKSIQQTLGEAEAMAGRGQHDQALVVVERAYAAVTKEVAALRDGDKLTKTLKFDTPVDEYIYEIDRNDSHFFLLKLTISEKNPDPMILKQVEDMRVKAQSIRTGAEDQAKRNNHKGAIDQLGQSTDLLIRALRMAGAYIPG